MNTFVAIKLLRHQLKEGHSKHSWYVRDPRDFWATNRKAQKPTYLPITRIFEDASNGNLNECHEFGLDEMTFDDILFFLYPLFSNLLF